MIPRYRSVKGTRDLLPPESERWNEAERIARETFRSRGYGEIRTPVLEDTALFARSVGETTDIVHKEMYTFSDRKGRSLTMRPENTAGVVRAVIENGLAAGPMPLRLYYMGPQFRYERPQAGRFREFSQIGVELFGVAGPAAEVEVLEMLFDFLRALGFQALSVSLNSVGTAATRSSFSEALQAHVLPKAASFGEDDRRKLAENPLRLFDSKDPGVRAALEGAPRTMDFLDEDSRRHHDEVRRLLADAGIPFQDEPSLVRGLDYYTRTVFEVVSADLGAQDAILGGGRYDGLVESLGGPALPAIGFAIGEDRLLQVAPLAIPRRACVVVLPQRSDDLPEAARIAREIRAALPGGCVEVDLAARGIKKGIARASSLFEEADARGFDSDSMLAVFVGERERSAGTLTVKRLATGEQETFPRSELAERLGAARER
ncbi:MAG TPA: histidine--tRNA ligase [Thermoanaerobaculia bacterium]